MKCDHCPLPCARPHIGTHWYLELFRTATGGHQLRIYKASDRSLVRCWNAALSASMLAHTRLRRFRLRGKVSYIDHGLMREVFLLAALCTASNPSQAGSGISRRGYGWLPCGGYLPTRADVIVGNIPTAAACEDRELWLASMGIG